MRWLRRLLGLDKALMSDQWLKDLGQRESRIEFHGSGVRWKFNRGESDQAWRNRWRLRREPKPQERKRA